MLDNLTLIVVLYMMNLVAILLHEYGHAIALVHFGGRVKSLNVGFGRVVYSHPILMGRLDTVFNFRIMPLGGFISLDTQSWPNPTRWQSIIVLASGVLMNLLLALITFVWICFIPRGDVTPVRTITNITIPQHFVEGTRFSVLPGYVLTSVKETEKESRWSFEAPIQSTDTSQTTMTLAGRCSPDCDTALIRGYGIELSKGFRAEVASGHALHGLTVLSIDDERFGSINSFSARITNVSQQSGFMKIEAICDQKYCRQQHDARDLAKLKWNAVPLKDQRVSSRVIPLLNMPFVMTTEMVRSSVESIRNLIAIGSTMLGVPKSTNHVGAFTRLKDHYYNEGVLWSRAATFFMLNIGLVVLNIIPFFGSDGYHILSNMVGEGKSILSRTVRGMLFAVSIGLAAFVLLGMAGSVAAIMCFAAGATS
ncbi:MAG: site-2 protease family protein [Burkholderiales bacterium]|jgi:membrane-associated protease RseP (regulator of RpoE activity)|nr:site-2 protease family protein [Betaproteobacteria bacterium]